MEYRVLGNSGLEVSTICLGTAAFGIAPLEEDAPKLVRRALDLGVNFFNTATHYGNRKGFDRVGVPEWSQRSSAEAILGAALRGARNEVVIATKVGMDLHVGPNGGGRYGSGLTRRMIVDRVEMSLRRLQTEYVDFLYAQSVDRNTPLEVTLRAFDDLVRQGKVLYYGLSNFPAWMMVDAVRITQLHHLEPIVGQEIGYNLVQRRVESEVIPACERFNLGLTIHTPLAGGLLTGLNTLKQRPATEIGFRRWQEGEGPGFTQGELQVAGQLDHYAREWGQSVPAVALSWLLSKPTVASVIIGAENAAELDDSVAGGSLRLNNEQLEQLNQLTPA